MWGVACFYGVNHHYNKRLERNRQCIEKTLSSVAKHQAERLVAL